MANHKTKFLLLGRGLVAVIRSHSFGTAISISMPIYYGTYAKHQYSRIPNITQ